MKPKILIIENEDDSLHNRLFFSWLAQRALGDLAETAVLYGPDGFPLADLAEFKGVLVGGSSASANDDKAWVKWEMALLTRALEEGIPILGCCFGHQLIAKAFGGVIRPRGQWNKGFDHVAIAHPDPIFADLESGFATPVCHSEEVSVLPSEFTLIGSSDRVRVMAMRHGHKPIWGVQFHAEVTAEIGLYQRGIPREWREPSSFEGVNSTKVLANFARLLR